MKAAKAAQRSAISSRNAKNFKPGLSFLDYAGQAFGWSRLSGRRPNLFYGCRMGIAGAVQGGRGALVAQEARDSRFKLLLREELLCGRWLPRREVVRVAVEQE